MPVKIAGSGLTPAPFLNYSKVYHTTEDGTVIGALFEGTIRGKIMPYKGSPSSLGVFSTTTDLSDETIPMTGRLDAVFRKQEALRIAFARQGVKLEFTPWNGGPALYCFPRFKGPIRFSEGQWVEFCDYEILFEADEIYGRLTPNGEDNFSGIYINRFIDEWSIDPVDEVNRAYKLTHNISAVGKRHYNVSGLLSREAWEEARAYVKPRMGIDTNRITSTGVLNLTPNFVGYNYTLTERVDKRTGFYGVNESWFVFNASGLQYPSFEDFTVDIKTDEVGRNTATINGTIKGLEVRNNTTHDLISTHWQNASGYFNQVSGTFHARTQSLAGMTLHSLPLNRSITKNHFNGIISYAFSYDDRPNNVVAGAISEIVTINDELPVDIFASHVVLGRYAGPVLQSIQTSGARRRTVTIEVLSPPDSQIYTSSRPNTNAIVASYVPISTIIFKERDTENWIPRQGRFSKQISWIYEQ